MPCRIIIFQCVHCNKPHRTLELAEECEEFCMTTAQCTMCAVERLNKELRHVADAAGITHHLCEGCWQELRRI